MSDLNQKTVPTSRPNILFIVSDDHGYGDLSFRGLNDDVHTPNLDRLAESGMHFDQGYVSAPICSPSRAGLMVGAHQQRWGARWFDTSAFAPEPFKSMPEVLKQAGYRTGYFGKIHYGADDYGSRSCPDQHGFDESFYGLAALSMGRLHYMRHGEEVVEEYGDAAKSMGVQPMVENGEKVSCANHLTNEFASRARDFMTPKGAADSSADNPFFCMVAFNAVHNFTWQLPEEELDERGLPKHPDYDASNDYLDWYDGAISPNLEHGREFYLAQLELMDREIGKMLDHLEETGQRENTLVVYITDNGGSTCNYGYNNPLQGTKYTLFEGGVRVPFIASWPAKIEPGQTSSALVSTLDLLPTFASAAGIDPAELTAPTDGIDLCPVLSGEQEDGHDELHFDTGFQWSVRTKDWKLRWVDAESKAREALIKVEHCNIGEGLTLTPISESLNENPNADVSEQHPEVVKDLMERRERWLSEVADTYLPDDFGQAREVSHPV